MNNWKIGKFLKVILAIQLAMLGLIGLAFIGYDIPFLRQILGFIYLTFVPGLLILRILRLHRLGTIETLLYSVGLSIAFVMFLGFFVNMLYPLIGISDPISILPLIITLSIAVAILCVVAYTRESRETMAHSQHHSIQWSEILSPPALFLFLLPLLSVLGAYYLANFHQNNILLLILIALIALVAALVAFNKFIPQRLYPLAVVMIAISLLWHWSLISQYLTGWDIQWEYYFQNLVLANSSWDPALPFDLNAVLSITMLAPIYSLILNMDTVWVFKIVYPLFFSLVPLALFQVFRKQTDDRIAFLAAFFFMSFFVFFTEMLALARQQIAELFFALSILLFLDKEMAAAKRAALLIIFGFSIIVSHYGLSYFYMFYLLMALPLLLLWRGGAIKETWRSIITRFSKFRPCHSDPERSEGEESRPFAIAQGDKINNPSRSTLSTTFVMLVVVFGLAWFMYTASGSPFNSIVHIGDQLYHSLGELFNPEARHLPILQALGLAPMRGGEVEWEIARVFQYVTQLFIVVGVIGLVFNRRKTKFQPVYIAMTLVSALLLAMSIILPYFAGFLNMTRIYHITLFFLAPFCVLGGITIFRWLFRLVPIKAFRASSNPIYLKLVVMLVLIPYLLFNTGFIFEVSGATPTSIALNAEMDWPRFNEQELSGKRWLLANKEDATKVFADQLGWLLLLGHIPRPQLGTFWGETSEIPANTYTYLRSWNVNQGEVMQSWEERGNYIELQNSPFYEEVITHRNKIYDNGGAQVYR
ncbi:DUF2206 domain-containing protein [Dehalococcoidia bacterium]|nr:DUF2206 domain-containing protein [Dehalococcoidia bacterium]